MKRSYKGTAGPPRTPPAGANTAGDFRDLLVSAQNRVKLVKAIGAGGGAAVGAGAAMSGRKAVNLAGASATGAANVLKGKDPSGAKRRKK